MNYKLTPYQKEAIDFLNKELGFTLVEGSVGIGKTFLTLFFIKSRPHYKFIIMVHSTAMISQWEAECESIFGEVLPNMEIYAYSKENDIKGFYDYLVIDEMHQLKGMKVKFRRCYKINCDKVIGLTGTPVDTKMDWYAYFKFMDVLTNRESFYWRYEAYGHHARRPKVRYGEYIDYHKTPMFKPDGFNNEELLYQDIDMFRIVIKDRDVLKGLTTIELNSPNVSSKLSYVEQFIDLHNKSADEKYYEIINHDKAIVICSYVFEFEFLTNHLDSDKYLVLQYRNGTLTGTDGIQKEHNTMIFYSPVASKSQLIQALGRIDRVGGHDNVVKIKFNSNKWEDNRWKKTLSK